MAVDNFLAFKKLMVKRNQELNKQAIELFQKLQEKNNAPATTETPTTAAAPAEAQPQVGTPVVAQGTPVSASGATNETTQMTPTQAKSQAEELKEVMKVAQQLEKQEEEELMKRAMEESSK